jgi:hypothetical protein
MALVTPSFYQFEQGTVELRRLFGADTLARQPDRIVDFFGTSQEVA